MFRTFTFGLLVALAFLPGCTPAKNPWDPIKPGQKKVLASFPPLYCFAANVAKDDAKVLCLLSTVGPHDYKADAKDAFKVTGADVFFINGLELDDPFAERLTNLGRSRKDRIVKVGDKIDDNLLVHTDEEAHAKEEKGHKHDHHHGDHDPHVWLGPVQVCEMVKTIASELSKLDPAHKKAFEDNAAAYLQELKDLEEYGKQKFAGKKRRAVVTMHEALAYFAKNFDLEIVGHIQQQAGQDIDPKNLAKLIEKCKQKNVRVITVEPQYAQTSAETLLAHLQKHGLKVELVVFDTLETAKVGADGNPVPGWYVEQMKLNIDRLAKALE